MPAAYGKAIFFFVSTTQEASSADISYGGQEFYPGSPAHLAFMRLLSCVYQVVFLQVGQLSEALVAGLALERSFSTVHSQVDLGRNHRGELWGGDAAYALSVCS